MKHWTDLSVLEYPWKLVTLAVWNKYPNPHAPHVISNDVLDRHLDQNNCLHTVRLISFVDTIPWPINKLFNLTTGDCLHALEYSIVDAHRQVHESHTINLTFNSLTQNCESLTYSSNPNHKTDVRLDISVDVNLNFICDLESFQIEKYKSSREKGMRALLFTLNNLSLNQRFDEFKKEVSKLFLPSSNGSMRYDSSHTISSKMSLADPQRFIKMFASNEYSGDEDYMHVLSSLLRFSWGDMMNSIKTQFESLASIFNIKVFDLLPQ
ncbi:hypothetical protein HZS_4085 [Henneguya salminicola]|nr:hypothetical protein HZS_4085 [Henneguya salminicola]